MNTDELLAAYEKSLGLPAGFINNLAQEGDDWSFTIKAHALVETGLTELVLHSIAEPLLDDMLSRLPITGRLSKLAICQKLKHVDDGDIQQFISVLGTIRNRLVHSIKRVEFSLTDYFHELQTADPNEFQRQRRALDHLFRDVGSVVIGGETVTTVDLFKSQPRTFIRATLSIVLAQVHVAIDSAKWRKDFEERGQKLLDKWLRQEFERQYATKASTGSDPERHLER